MEHHLEVSERSAKHAKALRVRVLFIRVLEWVERAKQLRIVWCSQALPLLLLDRHSRDEHTQIRAALEEERRRVIAELAELDASELPDFNELVALGAAGAAHYLAHVAGWANTLGPQLSGQELGIEEEEAAMEGVALATESRDAGQTATKSAGQPDEEGCTSQVPSKVVDPARQQPVASSIDLTGANTKGGGLSTEVGDMEDEVPKGWQAAAATLEEDFELAGVPGNQEGDVQEKGEGEDRLGPEVGEQST